MFCRSQNVNIIQKYQIRVLMRTQITILILTLIGESTNYNLMLSWAKKCRVLSRKEHKPLNVDRDLVAFHILRI